MHCTDGPGVYSYIVSIVKLYNPYRWFSILLYLVFLFVVIVVLLNLLIAQMSNTYATIQDEAEGTYAVARARILARLEKSRFFGCGQVGTYIVQYSAVCAYCMAGDASVCVLCLCTYACV